MPASTVPVRGEEKYVSEFKKYDGFVRHILTGNYDGFEQILRKRPEIIDCMELYSLPFYYIDIQNSFGKAAVQKFDAAVRQRLKGLETELDKTLRYSLNKRDKRSNHNL